MNDIPQGSRDRERVTIDEVRRVIEAYISQQLVERFQRFIARLFPPR